MVEMINHEPILFHFVAMEYYWGILNRTFRVYLTQNYICGAKVHGLIASPRGQIDSWNDPETFVNLNLLKKYDAQNISAPEFLSKNRSNFCIPRQKVVGVNYFPTKWGMGMVPHSGRVVLEMDDSGSKELILLGQQDSETVLSNLRN